MCPFSPSDDHKLICKISFHQDHILGRVPAPDPAADQEAGGAPAESVLQRRSHHPAPARPGREDCGSVPKPHEKVAGTLKNVMQI